MKIYDASGFNSKLTGSFTGSFYGYGSNLTGIVTYTQAEISGSSDLVSASLAASSNVVSASLAASISSITGFPFNGSAVITGSLLATTFVSASSITGSFKGDGSGITGINVTETQTVTDTFTSVSTKTVTHNFGTKNVFVSVYLNDDTQIIPSEVKTIDPPRHVRSLIHKLRVQASLFAVRTSVLGVSVRGCVAGLSSSRCR